MKHLSFIFCFIIFSFHLGHAQMLGLSIKDGKKKVKMSFEIFNNFIILPVKINGLPMRFILDSGAKHTILLHKEFADFLNLEYEREMTIYGADRITPLTVLVSRNIHYEFGDIEANQQSILVFKEDYFSFQRYLGTEIDGILGIDLFRRFVVSINYSTHEITFEEPESFKVPKRRYKELPLVNKNGQMFFQAELNVTPDSIINTRLLLDTGGAASLIVNVNRKDSLLMPKTLIKGNIGRGLGGFIKGYTGRIHKLRVHHYVFQNFIGSFQQIEDSLANKIIAIGNWREGILGSDILSRFNVIFHFQAEKAYFKPNKWYREAFIYDRSGLFIIASGVDFKTFTVDDVWPDSPAAQAGLQEGDKILKVNGISVKFLSLSMINKKFQKRIGKKISIKYERYGAKAKVKFRLKEIY